ncbi:MAG: sulfatase-like hydrolase/transferase, partial [Lentisphaeraceae bacterium]|nr:sulfatase-like hydrolase/transferase [Lentisphaeraceae bacterium]
TGHFGKWHIGPVEDNGTYGIDKIQTIGKSKDKTNGRDDDLTSAAIEFIKENSKKPFYVNIWGHSTHYPVTSAPKHAAKFIEQKVKRSDFSKSMQHKFDSSAKLDPNLDKSMHQYLGDVYSLDANVGRVMNAIEQLGIADNTIFVFSSDHGPAPVVLNKDKVMEYSKNMLGYAGIFKGGKHEQTEGGVRVPFIVRWPGKIKANRLEANSVVSFIDWLPTLCSIVGIEKLPPNLDGEDISDIWFGESRERKTDLYWKTSSTGGVASMRQGNWKFHM